MFTALIIVLFGSISLYGQNQPDRKGAFVRSLAVPGWGHYYAGDDHKMRGHFHLGTEITFIAIYAGLLYRGERLQNNYTTYANLKAGIELSGRSRQLKLAVGDFNSIHQYNDYQLRSRNWHRLLELSPENIWNWEEPSDREYYREMRKRRDRIQNSLPAVISLMAINRVVAAVSSVNRINRLGRHTGNLYFLPVTGPYNHQVTGITANFSIQI